MIPNISDKSYSSDPLFQAIRDRIVSHVYPPGTLLSEKDLTKEFEVSRTPYREAIRQLENMKLVKVVPRFGTYVSEIDITEIINAYEVRLRLETMAAELSAKRRTEEDLLEYEAILKDCQQWKEGDDITLGSEIDASLHKLVCKTSRNSILEETAYNLRLICGRIWTTKWRENYNFKQLISHWNIIYEGIKNKDSERASAAMESHIQDSIDLLKKNIFNYERLSKNDIQP